MFNKVNLIFSKVEKQKLLFLTLGSLILSLLETVSIGIIIPIMGLFLDPNKVYTSKALNWFYNFVGSRDVVAFIALLIFFAFFANVFKSIYSIFITHAQQDIIGKIYMRLSASALQAYLKKPYSFHLMNNSSVLFKNISFEMGQFISGFLTPAVIICSEIIILLGIFLFLIFVYPFVTLLLITFFGIIIASTYAILKKRIRLYSIEREEYSEKMYKSALETLHAVKEVTVFHANYFFVERFSQAVKKYNDAFVKFSVVSGLPRYLLETVLILFMLLLILLSIFLKKTPAEFIPMLTVFGVASLRLIPAFSKISSNINLFHYSTNSLNIVYSILKENNAGYIYVPTEKSSFLPKDESQSLSLKDITFCYESASSPIFENMSVNIPLNRTTAIVGITGSGKSTLIDIIMGLLIPSKGALYYRGLSINQGNVTEYRKEIGYVPQHIFLIDDSIKANIAFGIPCDKLDYKRLGNAIKIAQLESFIQDLENGVNTTIGERGVRISGGQRQRIGIARALYRDPDVLILDEATSALDTHTETRLYESLRHSGRSLTIIIVTHRLNAIEGADLIYLMDNGKVIDSGNYKDLSGRSPVFQKISKQKDATVFEK